MPDSITPRDRSHASISAAGAAAVSP